MAIGAASKWSNWNSNPGLFDFKAPHHTTSQLPLSATDKLLLSGWILKNIFLPFPFFSFGEGRKWKHSQTYENRGSLEGKASTTLAMGSFRKTAGVPSGCWIMAKPTGEDKKRQEKKPPLPSFWAFLIICFYSIWQQTGRFWKKSGDTATLVTNHSHFSQEIWVSGFVVLKL